VEFDLTIINKKICHASFSVLAEKRELGSNGLTHEFYKQEAPRNFLYEVPDIIILQ
jgi:hypothetical protein